MKYDFDSYYLYYTGKILHYVARVKITMKEEVDIDVLRHSFNVACSRYPYFKKKISVNEEGAYILEDNNEPLIVFKSKHPLPLLGSKEVNYHLIYADCEGKDIYFTISHSLAGGKGIQPWVLTCVYQYVKEKYNVEVNVPNLRKVDSELLPTELSFPTLDSLNETKPIAEFKNKKVYQPIAEYINGFVNPFMKKEQYYTITFDQNEFIKFSKNNDSSVASLFSVIFFKTLDKVINKRHKVIRAAIAHNPCEVFNIPHSHSDYLTHVFVDYPREYASYDIERLNTITRGNIIWQTDKSISSNIIRKTLLFREGIDERHSLKEKRKYANKANPNLGKDVVHGSYNINYSGYIDWGELVNYVDGYCLIVDGHLLSEITSLGDKISMNLMGLIKLDKYIVALKKVLEEIGLSYVVEGPFDKNLPYQEFRRK